MNCGRILITSEHYVKNTKYRRGIWPTQHKIFVVDVLNLPYASHIDYFFLHFMIQMTSVRKHFTQWTK